MTDNKKSTAELIDELTDELEKVNERLDKSEKLQKEIINAIDMLYKQGAGSIRLNITGFDLSNKHP